MYMYFGLFQLLETESVKNSSFLTLLVEYLPSFVITGLNVILPLVLEKIVLIEDYSPEYEVKITIFRWLSYVYISL